MCAKKYEVGENSTPTEKKSASEPNSPGTLRHPCRSCSCQDYVYGSNSFCQRSGCGHGYEYHS